MQENFFDQFESETLYSTKYAEKMHRRGWWEEMSVGDYLDWRVEEYGDELAVKDRRMKLTWRELQQEADRLAAGLRDMGVERGDRVSLQLPNRIEWHIARLGIHRAGAVVSTMMPRFREKEITHILETVQPTAYIGVADYRDYNHVETALQLRNKIDALDHVISVGEAAPNDAHPFNDICGEAPEDFTPDGIHPDYPDRLKTSGGTTGLPKIFYYSHNVRAQGLRELTKRFGITKRDDILALAPFPHGISTPLAFTGLLLTGATCIIGNPSTSPEGLLEQIEEYEPSVVTIAPTQLNKMRSVVKANADTLNSVRLISFSGEPLSADTAKYFEEMGPKMVTYYGFGAGGAPFISCPGDPPEERHNSAGKPVIPGEVRIIDERGNELPPGKTGEVIWKGPWLTLGYYCNQEATEEIFEIIEGDIWVHSEDAGQINEEGNLTIEGRQDDMIIRGGENIFPAPIENILVEHEDVHEAAVIGMPDPEYGQRPCAYVRSPREIPLEELTAVMDDTGLAKFKWPERIEIIGELPKTAAGKIDKKSLREDIEARLDREGRLS